MIRRMKYEWSSFRTCAVAVSVLSEFEGIGKEEVVSSLEGIKSP